MKLTKIEYKKLEGLMPIARKPEKISNYEYMCAMLYIIENGCKLRGLPKKYGNWHTIYTRFSRCSKNGTISKILEAMKKQKLLNEENYILFIDSTSMKVSPDASRSRNTQEQSIGRSKGDNNEVTFVLYSFVSSSLSFVSRQLS